ncbi:bifunctional diguanylate cyclase/phosphodiesterase [Nocardioides sp. cx-173]|uniref:putative bifunctional diguanylate cyclase/phosphodiesterase n=1 Tax=Nocardioides sp. cx-173 TaxID=2898796 RepID=UPI001E2951E2|nr:EAL domain-containing protein [Nocardioides sp. cx-173]MCD4527272.1 GGDEF and EAL domain-containing protein [Nocardioides sp. cx-173]UGB40351.1 GGDEF and EAL domain-containing protein [Nocardioides sp. cx-173]
MWPWLTFALGVVLVVGLVAALPVARRRRIGGGRTPGPALVAEHRQAFEALHEAQVFNEAVLAASPDVMVVLDLVSGDWEWTSRNVWEALGEYAASTAEAPAGILRHLVEEDRALVYETMARLATLPDGESVMIRFRLRRPGGPPRWILGRATPFARGSGRPRALAVLRDVTEIAELDARLQHSALHDPLTGLPNRSRLVELITTAEQQGDDAGDLALMFCDLDRFKHINDTYGHAAGDAVLVEVGRRLQGALRAGDSVARVGGDEFVALLAPTRGSGGPPQSPAERSSALESLARRIQDRVSGPIEHAGNELEVTFSVGIATVSRGAAAADALRDADDAMYRAKRSGRGRVSMFDEALRTERESRLRVATALAHALAPTPEGLARLSVVYQPVLDLRGLRLMGWEALARLTDQEGKAIAPDQFIPVAEDLGVVHLLDQEVLELSLTALREWTVAHPAAGPLTMAVNVSASQVHRVNLTTVIRSALERHGIPASSLVVEVTESVLLGLGSSTLGQLRELHDLGVAVAIDDFGTGYASLQYLTTLPVDALKIDRSFTQKLSTDPTSAAIIRAVAALAAELGLTCIVEGIETQAQLEALPPGVLGQGFLLGEPRPTLSGEASTEKKDFTPAG